MVLRRRPARKVCFALFSLLCTGLGTAAAAGDTGRAAERKTLNRDPDYVIIKGTLLADLLGARLSDLGLYASVDGEIRPIPFQIDECDPRGRLVCPSGAHPESDADGGSTERYMNIRNRPLTIVTSHGTG